MYNNSMDYIKAFYEQTHTIESLVANLDSLLGSQRDLQIKCFPIYINPDFFRKFVKCNNSHFKLIKTNQNIYLFSCFFPIRYMGEIKNLSGKVFFIEDQKYPGIFNILTLDNSVFFKRGLFRYFSKLYSNSSMVFISHNKLKQLLFTFKQQNSFQYFIISRASTRFRIAKNIVPSVNWPSVSLEKAFEWATEEDAWFNNIMFKVKKAHSPEAIISISRNGIIKSNLFFKNIYNCFLIPLSEMLHNKIEFFSKRSRLENPQKDIKPLCIEFDIERFTDRKENKKFISAIQSLKAASVSVLHSNPYIHLSIIDYYDGSILDLWVLSKDKIIIIPQLKGTFQSIKRLVNHIFDNYGEGEIKNYSVD